jgi:hypothetical protein
MSAPQTTPEVSEVIDRFTQAINILKTANNNNNTVIREYKDAVHGGLTRIKDTINQLYIAFNTISEAITDLEAERAVVPPNNAVEINRLNEQIALLNGDRGALINAIGSALNTINQITPQGNLTGTAQLNTAGVAATLEGLENNLKAVVAGIPTAISGVATQLNPADVTNIEINAGRNRMPSRKGSRSRMSSVNKSLRQQQTLGNGSEGDYADYLSKNSTKPIVYDQSRLEKQGKNGGKTKMTRKNKNKKHSNKSKKQQRMKKMKGGYLYGKSLRNSQSLTSSSSGRKTSSNRYKSRK